MKTRVLFLVRSLDAGGAERQLIELVRLLAPSFDVTVCTFYPGGALRGELEGLAGIRLIDLGKGGRWDLGVVSRLRRVVRSLRPHIVHGYMGAANELSLAAGRFAGAKVVWGIRASFMGEAQYGFVPWALMQVGRAASQLADLIIANSNRGREYYIGRGYPRDRMIVIPNGTDVDRFRPRPEVRDATRRSWGVEADDVLVGLVARVDPIKDHETFLQAAAVARRANPMMRFACIGGGSEARRQGLVELSRRLGIEDRVLWLGHQPDMSAAYAALDVCTLTSKGEGFPNVLTEAMACGVPCVSTDAGDAREILGDLGTTVPVGDAKRLGNAWVEMAGRTRAATPPEVLRDHVATRYSLERLRDQTRDALEGLLSGGSRG